MKTLRNQKPQTAFALVVTIFFVAIGAVIFAAILNWAQTNARLVDRNNEYTTTISAAEAAIEKTRSKLLFDYKHSGKTEAWIYSQVTASSRYQQMPAATDGDPMWNNYSFSTLVRKSGTNRPYIDPAFPDMTSLASVYQIIVNVTNNTSKYKIPACVGAEIYLGTTPLFQYAIFYQEDLEIHPGAPMTVGGLVHCNSDIYASSAVGNGLTFLDTVSASGKVYINQVKPGDSNAPRGPAVTNKSGPYLEGVPTQNLPIGTNAANIHAMLEVPPANEDPNTDMGTNRYYNKADLIIKITNTNMIALGGVGFGNGSIVVTNFPFNKIVDTTGVFYDLREDCNVNVTAINIDELRKWSASSTNLLRRSDLMGNRDVSTVYAVDQRTYTLVPTNFPAYGTNYMGPTTTKPGNGTYISGTLVTINGNPTKYTYSVRLTNYVAGFYTNPIVEAAIVLTNGAWLPTNGLTFATQNPVYIKGDYNTTTNNILFSRSTNATAYTTPAAILCDAVTILSSNWKDDLSISGSSTTSNRKAATTTVNAAFLTGNVVTSTNNGYSGGVENFPRFLEDWSSSTFWYNGSMVCMFPSKIATGTRGAGPYYSPPTRKWAFDRNFTSGKLPTNTPNAMVSCRGSWKVLPPGSTNF